MEKNIKWKKEQKRKKEKKKGKEETNKQGNKEKTRLAHNFNFISMH